MKLTDEQQELLRKLVKYDKERKLSKPILIHRSDDYYSVVLKGVRFSDYLHLEWVGDLDILCDAEYLKKHSEIQYSILQSGYEAVENDFQQETVIHEPLRQQLAQHRGNLNKLEEQAAIYGAGEHPLSLLNKIEFEQKAIEELEIKIRNSTPPNID